MLQPLVVIIILNYNRADDTIECISSLQKIHYNNYKILIIDNHSTNDSVQKLKDFNPNLWIIKTNKNLGYTGGINFGIRKALSCFPKYLLLLNNDTITTETFLTELVRAIEKYPDAAIASGLILAEHDKKTIWYAGGKMVRWRGLAIHKEIDKEIGKYENGKIGYTTFVTGCMMLIRVKYLEKIGIQNEKFFMYLDDIEYSARTINRGYKLVYTPHAVIYHKVLDQKDNPFMLYYSVRNRLLLIKLAFGGYTRFIARFYYLVVISLKILIWTFSKPLFSRAARQGLVDYYENNLYEGRGITEFLDKK